MSSIQKIILLNFITMTAFNMAHPVTPKLINELQLPSYMFGVLFAFMAIANFIMSPIWGSLSDAKGRRKFLIIGVIGYGLAQIGFGFSSNEFAIIIFRLMAGTFSICYITASIAYVTDLTTSENRVKYISYYTAAASLGSSAGSFLGGIVGNSNYKHTFLSQSVFCFIIAIILALYIKESIVENKRAIISLNHLKLNKNFVNFQCVLSTMMIIVTLITISTTAYNSTISYYVESVLKLPTTINGGVMSVAGIIALCVNVFINPYIDKRFNYKKAMILAVFISSISILAASIFDNLYISGIFILIFIVFSSLLVPMYQNTIASLSNNNRGEVMGMQGSAKALGMVIGSLLSGVIFEYGEKLPFILAGVSAVVATLILVKLFLLSKNESI